MEPIELQFLKTKDKPGKAPGYGILSHELAAAVQEKGFSPKGFATEALWYAEEMMPAAGTAETVKDFSCKDRICIGCKDILALTVIYAVLFMKARHYGITIAGAEEVKSLLAL